MMLFFCIEIMRSVWFQINPGSGLCLMTIDSTCFPEERSQF